MNAARKYFDLESEHAGEHDDDLERKVSRINKNLSEGSKERYFSPAAGYEPPTAPNDAVSVADEGPTPARRTHSSSPLKYLACELMQGLRESLISDPKDPLYQVSRKISIKVISEPKGTFETVVQEACSIGIYRVLSEALKTRRQVP